MIKYALIIAAIYLTILGLMIRNLSKRNRKQEAPPRLYTAEIDGLLKNNTYTLEEWRKITYKILKEQGEEIKALQIKQEHDADRLIGLIYLYGGINLK